MKNKFIKGAIILSVSNIIIKIIGVFYRIPLSKILTTEGLGYVSISNDIYNLFIGLSTSGINLAVAKLVSERIAIKDYYGVKKTFRLSLLIVSIAGIVLSSLLFLSGNILTRFLKNENVYYSIVALSPGLLFVPIMSSFRGYFQGHNNMAHTAISQLIEQIFRVLAGLLLAWTLIGKGKAIASGGVSLGVSIAALAALLYLIIVYWIDKRSHSDEYNYSNSINNENRYIIRDILKISLPLSLGAIAMPLISFVEKAMITRRLLGIGYIEKEAANLIGEIALGRIIISFPIIFSVSLSTSILPVIAQLVANNNTIKLNNTMKSSLYIIVLIGFPATFGILVLSEPIIRLLFIESTKNIELTSQLLSISSLSIIFIMIMQCLNVYLNGLGKVHIPIINILFAGVIKLILTYALLSFKMISLYGAVISSVIFYIIIVLLDFIAIKQYTSIEIDINKFFLKPFISSLIMSFIVYIVKYIFLSEVANIFSIFIAIIVGIFAYSILVFKFIGIEERQLSVLPFNSYIIPMLKRTRLLK